MGVLVGMIGATHPHSAGYLRTFTALDSVDAVALYDPEPRALAQAAAACPKIERTYADRHALLARPDVPIVLIALPTNQVPAIAVEAARAGKHIICEKPCARSAAELRPVLAALNETGRQFTVPYIWRAHPAIRQTRRLVLDGALGQVTSVEMRMVTTRVGLRDPSHWLFKRAVAGGGILSWLGCHWLDLFRFLTGQEVAAASALTATRSGEPIDVEDVASVSLRLDNGAIGSLYAGYLLPAGRPGYEGAAYDQSIILRGTHGALDYRREGDDHVVSVESIAAGWETAPRQAFRYRLPPSFAYGGVHGLEFFENFIHLALTGEGSSLVSATDALRVLEILDAAYESARQGRTIELVRGETSG